MHEHPQYSVPRFASDNQRFLISTSQKKVATAMAIPDVPVPPAGHAFSVLGTSYLVSLARPLFFFFIGRGKIRVWSNSHSGFVLHSQQFLVVN